MSSNSRVPASQVAVPMASASGWLRAAGIVLAGSAFVAACAHIALPLYFTPVPLSMQPFAVLLLGLLLEPRLAAATLAAYLGEGAIGLPVFSPGSAGAAGLAHLFGPTAGYLLAYPFAVALISVLYRRWGRRFSAGLSSTALGSLVILIAGALWLSLFTHVSIPAVMTQAVLPFLPGDALKIVAAAGLAAGWQRWRHRNSQTSLTQ